MRVKSPRELDCIRAACATLQAAVAAMAEAKRKGAGVTATILAGEHVAIQRGAQEVRSLFSLDGGRTLRPFSVPVEQAVDPLQVYIAVRHAGYWADGFVVLADTPPADLAKAQDALRRYLSAVKPGAPVAAPLAANGIGLALEEPVSVSRLEAGGVYSVRTTYGHACVSAMVAVSETGVETLWSAA
jgi:Xaa-Pro aminopeptidase